jgi:hypothetical protein
MSRDLYRLFAPDPVIRSSLKPAYEFSHVATYGNDVPHTVVFQSDIADDLRIPVGRFEMGHYEEWKDPDVLSTREVSRAAGELALRR